KAMFLEDVSDRAVRELMTEVGQYPLNALVAPARVFLGKTHHQIDDLGRQCGSARLLLAAMTVIPFLGHQFVVPAHDSVWCEQRGDLTQELVAQDFAFDSQASALRVVQDDSAFAELFSEELETVFIAPSLIAHYVAAHNYRPPQQFIEAVSNSDPDRSASESHATTAIYGGSVLTR